MPGQDVVPRALAAGPDPAEDRRAFRRYPADLQVSCRALGAARADSWPARLRDISTGGIGLVPGRRFEAGTLLAVELVNTPSGSPRTLLSRVMHVHALPEREWLLGLALLREMGEDELRTRGAEVARPQPPDARAWARFPYAIPGLCSAAGAALAKPWQAKVVNISPGGFGLIAPPRPRKERTSRSTCPVPTAGTPSGCSSAWSTCSSSPTGSGPSAVN
jgi:hypothetical protein